MRGSESERRSAPMTVRCTPASDNQWESRDADIESVLEAVGEEAIGAELVRADVDADAAVAIAIDASRQARDVEGRGVRGIVARIDRG